MRAPFLCMFMYVCSFYFGQNGPHYRQTNEQAEKTQANYNAEYLNAELSITVSQLMC